ncbi:Hypothetical_protein [Hexamita inflata]|uniref:Hypothetical_protein n=1 Tax=Hexamita inflata TaxID=28002 RepID=A0AA86NGK9_9EUKA|nr:Hypothetical protein HINF_LOCUS6383 [Hexamita inflata]
MNILYLLILETQIYLIQVQRRVRQMPERSRTIQKTNWKTTSRIPRKLGSRIHRSLQPAVLSVRKTEGTGQVRDKFYMSGTNITYFKTQQQCQKLQYTQIQTNYIYQSIGQKCFLD